MTNTCKALIEKDGKYLLLRRTNHPPRFNKLWDFPGGKQNGEETLEQTLIREVKEETKLDIIPNKIEKDIELKNEEFDMHFFIYSIKSYTGEITLSFEPDKLAWYSKDELKKLDLHAPVKLFFEND